MNCDHACLPPVSPVLRFWKKPYLEVEKIKIKQRKRQKARTDLKTNNRLKTKYIRRCCWNWNYKFVKTSCIPSANARLHPPIHFSFFEEKKNKKKTRRTEWTKKKCSTISLCLKQVDIVFLFLFLFLSCYAWIYFSGRTTETPYMKNEIATRNALL